MKRLGTMLLVLSMLLCGCGNPPPPDGARFARNGEIRIHWHEQGSGTPVLLIMGHRYSSRMWYPVIPALAQHHRVIAFDNRGTGFTDTDSDYEIQDMARDALAVMDAAGVESAHVYGVSLGGGIAYEMALQQPQRVRSLILGCTRLKTEPREPKRWGRLTYALPAPLMNLFLTRDKDQGSAADPVEIAFARDVVRSDPYSGRGVYAQSAATARYSTSTEAVGRLSMPALVLHGDEDRTVAFEAGQALAKALPNSRFEPMKGAGHNYFLAQREHANRLVLEFLEQVDAQQTDAH